MEEKSFEFLSKALCEPVIETQEEELTEIIAEILRKDAARGFPIPPGSMYIEVSKAHKENLVPRAAAIWRESLKAYNACRDKPTKKGFEKLLVDALSSEARRLTSGVERMLEQHNAQFKIPDLETFVSQNEYEISQECRRLERYYLAQCDISIETSKSSGWAESPLQLKPNFFGLGVDLMKLGPWIRKLLRRRKH
ncbi:MAG: hypothetical protein ACREV0_05205 [Burkholderiales bacterium]